MAISVPEVAAHIASSLLIGAAAVVVSGIVASFAARKYGGLSTCGMFVTVRGHYESL
jgi:hypothetical protein